MKERERKQTLNGIKYIYKYVYIYCVTLEV